MARRRFAYRLQPDGHYKAVETQESVTREDYVNMPFNERMLRSYYDLECQQGARFRPDYNAYGRNSANVIKRAWERPD